VAKIRTVHQIEHIEADVPLASCPGAERAHSAFFTSETLVIA